MIMEQTVQKDKENVFHRWILARKHFSGLFVSFLFAAILRKKVSPTLSSKTIFRHNGISPVNNHCFHYQNS